MHDIRKNTLEDLGYDAFFDTHRKEMGLDHGAVARVMAVYRGAYTVGNENGEYAAKITGKRMFNAASPEDFPAIGDWVAITDLDGEHATINCILPRKTLLQRTHGDKSRGNEKSETQIIAANIDVAFIVESVDRDFNVNRFERYVVIATEGGVTPTIILNKTDLMTPEALDATVAELKRRFKDIDIITTSTQAADGIQELKKHIQKGTTYCFLGSSGVGKSSLINTLLGTDMIKTLGIGIRTGRGKHTTTGREMYFLENGGIVIDNPGMREVGIPATSTSVDACFDEIILLAQQCRFTDCTHVHEHGCAVLGAVHAGTLDTEKYSNYVTLKKESDFLELTELEKRNKDRQFGKFMHTYKKRFMSDGE